MKFTKMQGLGNDYLYVFGEVPEEIAELSIRLSDRHFGAGSDGMIYISPSEKADFRMRIFNADGSEAKMCGNGIRCVGKYVYDRGYTDKTKLRIETLSGIRNLELSIRNGKVREVQVDMGIVVVGADLSLDLPKSCGWAAAGPGEQPAAGNPGASAAGTPGASAAPCSRITLTPVDVGNPHAVAFVKDAEAVPLDSIGPLIEKHQTFPGGVNAEFVQILGEQELRMRVWERGSGITMACGTGACASAAAAVRKGFCEADQPIRVHLDGGTLKIRVGAQGNVTMTGPAKFVYDGEVL